MRYRHAPKKGQSLWISVSFALMYCCFVRHELMTLRTSQQENFPLVFFTEPVTDLFLHPQSIQTHPGASASFRSKSCRRSHQALLHDIAPIITELGDAICIQVHTLCYGHDEHNKCLKTFWCPRNKVCFLDPLNHDHRYLPHEQNEKLVITIPHAPFSVGTYFRPAPDHDTIEAFGAFAWDTIKKRFVIIQIPKIKAQHHTKLGTENQKRQRMLQLLNNLIQYYAQQQLVIPYVWGGSSCCYGVKPFSYTQDSSLRWINTIDESILAIESGYDCSELVWRFANIAGFDYLPKICLMIPQLLPILGPNEQAIPGDLVTTPGHVIILDNNECIIESSGYDRGFGHVRREQLKKYFANCSTLDELSYMHKNKMPLLRINRDGSYSTLSEWHIVRLTEK